jgi:hypothetical protein
MEKVSKIFAKIFFVLTVVCVIAGLSGATHQFFMAGICFLVFAVTMEESTRKIGL